jgi:hypothetical protein
LPIPEFLPGFVPHQAEDAFADSGAVILRQALADYDLRYLHLYCTALFSILDMKVEEFDAQNTRLDDPLTRHVELYRRLQFVGEDLAVSLLAHSYLSESGFSRTARSVGIPLATLFPTKSMQYVPHKSVLRRQGTRGQARKSAYVTWHRDSHAVRTAEFAECLNCWIPLQAVGIDRPSLQIVLGSNKTLQDRPVDYEADETSTDDQVRTDFDNAEICTAILDPGDILLFGHHTLHRTQQMTEESPSRISAELRFAGNP